MCAPAVDDETDADDADDDDEDEDVVEEDEDDEEEKEEGLAVVAIVFSSIASATCVHETSDHCVVVREAAPPPLTIEPLAAVLWLCDGDAANTGPADDC